MKIRFCLSYYSEYEMVKPLISELCKCKEHDFEFSFVQGSILEISRNMHFTNGKNELVECDAFLIFDSDMYTPASTIYKMIELDKGVVVAPYQTHDDNDEYHCGELDENGSIKLRYTSKETGLKPITYTSEGCMLIKREVIEHIHDTFKTVAFFGTDYYRDQNGIEKARSLDLRICRLIQEIGYEIWCDFDLKVQHRKRKEYMAKKIEINDSLLPTESDIQAFIKKNPPAMEQLQNIVMMRKLREAHSKIKNYNKSIETETEPDQA